MTPASESWICRIAASISLTSRHTTAAPMIFPPLADGAPRFECIDLGGLRAAARRRVPVIVLSTGSRASYVARRREVARVADDPRAPRERVPGERSGQPGLAGGIDPPSELARVVAEHDGPAPIEELGPHDVVDREVERDRPRELGTLGVGQRAREDVVAEDRTEM